MLVTMVTNAVPLRRALFGAIALTFAVARAASACSLAPPWALRDTALVAFMATSLPDTVPAGDGGYAPVAGLGHYGRGAARQAYGQRFRLDQLGAHARRVFPASAAEVVIVPWDYDAGCRRVAWGRSARWLAEGTSGLFRARLRAREHWVDSLPTFDVSGTSFLPYTVDGETARRRGELVPPRLERMSPEELLRFYDVMPPHAGVADSVAALAAMRRLAADSVRATRYPVSEILWSLRTDFERAREDAVKVPVAGTFRLEFSRDGGPIDTLFLRVAAGVTSLDHGRGAGREPLVPPTPRGYFAAAAVARSLETLAPGCTVDGSALVAYIDLDWHPPMPPDGNGAWAVGFDSRLFEALLPADSVRTWRARARALMDARFAAVRAAQAAGTPTENVAWTPNRALRATQVPGAPMRLAGSITVEALGHYQVRGERISPEVLACPW